MALYHTGFRLYCKADVQTREGESINERVRE